MIISNILVTYSQCVGQELDKLALAVFATSAVAKIRDPQQKVIMRVSDPNEEYLLQEKIQIGAKLKEIELMIEDRGLYEMCFEVYGGKNHNRLTEIFMIMIILLIGLAYLCLFTYIYIYFYDNIMLFFQVKVLCVYSFM